MRENLQRAVLISGIVGLSAAVTYVAYATFFLYLFETWKIDPFYLHGPWILGVSLLLYIRFIWQKGRSALLLHDKKSFFRAVAAIFISVFFLILGALTHLPFLGGLSFFFWLLALHLTFFEIRFWKELSFPLGYFLLAVPLPYLGELSGLLQIWVAALSAYFLNFLGYPIIQEGINLYLPQAAIRIAADCTGIKSWLVLMSLAIFFTYFVPLKFSRKIFLILFILPIAFISNFIRVQILLLLGFYYGQQTALQYWHQFSGVTFYLLSCLLVLGMGWGMMRRERAH